MKKCSSYLLSLMFSMGIVGSSLKANLPAFGGEFPLEPDAQDLYFQNLNDLTDPSYLHDDAVNSFLELPNHIDGSDSIRPANQIATPAQPIATDSDTGTVLKQRKKRKRTGYNPLSQSLLQRLSVVDRKGMSEPLFWDAVKKINLTCVVDDKNRGKTGLFNVFKLFDNAMQNYNKTPNNKSYYRDYMRYQSYLRKISESCDSSTLSEFNNNEQKNMLKVLDLIGQHYGDPEAAVIQNISARFRGDQTALATIPSILENSKSRKPRNSPKPIPQTDAPTTQTIAGPASPHTVSQVVSSDIAPSTASTLGDDNPQIATDQSTIIPQQTDITTPILNSGMAPTAMNQMTTLAQSMSHTLNTRTMVELRKNFVYNPLGKDFLRKISKVQRRGISEAQFIDGVAVLNSIGIVKSRNGWPKGFLASFISFFNAFQMYLNTPNTNHKNKLLRYRTYLRNSLNAIQPLGKIDNNVKIVTGLFEQHYEDHCYKEILQNALARLQGDSAALATIPHILNISIPSILENPKRGRPRNSPQQNLQTDTPTTQTMASPVPPHAVSQVVSSDIAPNATSTFGDENLQIVTDPNATISDPIDFGGEFPSRTGIQDMYFQNPDDWTDLSDLWG